MMDRVGSDILHAIAGRVNHSARRVQNKYSPLIIRRLIIRSIYAIGVELFEIRIFWTFPRQFHARLDGTVVYSASS